MSHYPIKILHRIGNWEIEEDNSFKGAHRIWIKHIPCENMRGKVYHNLTEIDMGTFPAFCSKCRVPIPKKILTLGRLYY